MAAITVKAPENTFYVDYTIENGKCYAIFEHDDRITKKFVGNTTKTDKDWASIDISETKDSITINLNED